MSAYEYTLEDARSQSRLLDVIQNCPTSADFADKLNSVTRMLMKRGKWWNTEVVVKICVTGCNIVWPRYVGTVTGIRFCCYGQMEIKNNWYSIMGNLGCGNSAGYGAYANLGHGGWLAPTMYDRQTTPVHTQITGNNGKFLRYYVVKPQDIGKTIHIFGTQYGGQPLQELDANGNWVMGITLTAAAPYAQSTALVTRIDQVTRERTQGMTYLYQYDAAMPGTGQLQLAVYEPNETNPQYRQSRVTGINQIQSGEGANGEQLWTLDAMVKLQYFEVVNERDFLFISDWDALAYGVQALNADNQNDTESAEVFFAKAIRELNFESRDKNPADNFVVKARFMGSQTIVSNPI
jgi:hypothetical protein